MGHNAEPWSDGKTMAGTSARTDHSDCVDKVKTRETWIAEARQSSMSAIATGKA
jgi:hypothetical protein